MRYLAVDAAPALPRTVWAPGWLAGEVARAMDLWNRLRPGTFAWAEGHADVLVAETTGRTWVDFASAWPNVTVHCGPDLGFWMPHELGHALGLADHILPGMDATGYVRPVEASAAYRGVMSYQATRDDWFGPDDVALMRAVFPFEHVTTIPGVCRG